MTKKHHTLAAASLLACLACAAPPPAAAAPAQELESFARRHGLTDFRVRDKNITMTGRFHVFELLGNSRRASCNGTAIWLNHPVAPARGHWTVSGTDAEKTFLPLLAPAAYLKTVGYELVVLDAGHGGRDAGAISPRRVEEKRVTLYLARRVRDLLQKQGVKVRLTRDGDSYLSLEDRCRLASRWKASLFVSIHMNAAASRAARGIETHILPPAGAPITADTKVTERDRTPYPANRHDGANLILGYVLQRNMLRSTKAEDRGVRRSRFYVTRNNACPAALVEGGFISNPGEEQQIIQKAYRDKLADGIARGILEYLAAVRQAHQAK